MHRFLMLFPAFRFLEARVQDLHAACEQRDETIGAFKELWEKAEKDLAEARASLTARAEHWEIEYLKANAEAIKARETITDFLAQIHFGRKVFDHAPVLPEKPPADRAVPKMRQQARIRVQQGEAQFAKDLHEYVKRRVDGARSVPAPADQEQFEAAAV